MYRVVIASWLLVAEAVVGPALGQVVQYQYTPPPPVVPLNPGLAPSRSVLPRPQSLAPLPSPANCLNPAQQSACAFGGQSLLPRAHHRHAAHVR